ncbi:MAG: hypothetical protein AAGA48_24995 [Myxococcota bacterium]
MANPSTAQVRRTPWRAHPVFLAGLTASLIWLPATLLLPRKPMVALMGVPEVGWLLLGLLGLASVRPDLAQHSLVRGVVVAAWGGFGLFGVAWAASVIATDELLPLYDLMLLVQPVAVFIADLAGPVAPVAVVVLGSIAAIALLWFASVAIGHLTQASQHRGTVVTVALIGATVGSALHGPWSPTIVSNLAESIALHDHIEERVVSRTDLVARELTTTPDVRVYVIESYGDVLFEGAIAPTHRATLAKLEGPLRAAGWTIASGRGISPTHGGRSWMADATLLTGIHVDRQATFDHVARRGRSIPSLTRFFADRGYATVLVRPKDRVRPGVRLVNHFGFETTVFHDDLDYQGPKVGWGFIPDQYTIEVAERRFVAPIEDPLFAFFHLATSHHPFRESPPILDDAQEWQTMEGYRGHWNRKPVPALWMTFARYRSELADVEDKYGATYAAYQAVVGYDLEVLATRLAPPTRPTLMLWLGDHQPPFLAEGHPPYSVIHVLASDPAWLDPFLAEGFQPGLDPGPRGEPTLRFDDLFERILDALAPMST